MFNFSKVQAALRRHDRQLLSSEDYIGSSTDGNLQPRRPESRQSIYRHFFSRLLLK